MTYSDHSYTIIVHGVRESRTNQAVSWNCRKHLYHYTITVTLAKLRCVQYLTRHARSLPDNNTPTG